MIDIRFEIGGRRIEPRDIGDALQTAILESIAEQIRAKVRGVCHPQTGEAAVVVVRGDDLEHLSIEVSGSEELVRLVGESLGVASSGGKIAASESGKGENVMSPPIAFLCHATEDKALARRIAADLQGAGIETFFDEWEMRAGDSLRQKIDAGLDGCSHFIALLSPVALTKLWVNAEMDGAFVRKLAGACRFIALRHGLAPEILPPLLRGSLSPSVSDYNKDVKALIDDIHGINRKPPLGPKPTLLLDRKPGTGLSPAAEAVVRFALETSKAGMPLDPQISPDDLRHATGLIDDDIVDAIDELEGRGLLRRYQSFGCDRIGFHMVAPQSEMFAAMDKHFMGWNPEEDSLVVAADLVNNGKDGEGVAELAGKLGWPPRRMNPAVAYLVNRQIVKAPSALGTSPWTYLAIMRTPATRRFVRDRS
jgi:TIR domain